MINKIKYILKLFVLIITFYIIPFISMGDEIHKTAQTLEDKKQLEFILQKIEQKYSGESFSADFIQKSTIKAMDITDYAKGKVFFKRPGMMRWEYNEPEIQKIITDGKTLWIYKPDDMQVMKGKATDFFEDGKGAGFLADIKSIKEKFDIVLDNSIQGMVYRLKLIPKKERQDLIEVYLSILKDTFEIVQVITYNSYNDETVINLQNVKLNDSVSDSIFNFQVPENVDLIYLNQ